MCGFMCLPIRAAQGAILPSPVMEHRMPFGAAALLAFDLDQALVKVNDAMLMPVTAEGDTHHLLPCCFRFAIASAWSSTLAARTRPTG